VLVGKAQHQRPQVALPGLTDSHLGFFGLVVRLGITY
jgi:hypothetical protein